MKKYIVVLAVLLLTCQIVRGATYSAFLRDTGVDGTTIRVNDQKQIELTDEQKSGAQLNSGTPYYVDSVNGANNRSGKTWALAVASINSAIDLISAARTAGTELGDSVVYVREGSVSTLSVSSALALDVAGVLVKGLGWGGQRPTLTVSGITLSPIQVLADDVWLDNLIIKSADFYNVSQGTQHAIYVASVDGFRMTNCEVHSVSPGKFIRGVQLAEGSDNAYIAKNLFRLSPSIDLVASAAIEFATVSGITIVHNTITGLCDFGSIYGAKVGQDILITHNLAYNGTMAADASINNKPAITVPEGSAGLIAHNDVAALLLPAAMIVGDDMTKIMNRVVQSDGDEFSGFYENLYTASIATGAGSSPAVASQVND